MITKHAPPLPLWAEGRPDRFRWCAARESFLCPLGQAVYAYSRYVDSGYVGSYAEESGGLEGASGHFVNVHVC